MRTLLVDSNRRRQIAEVGYRSYLQDYSEEVHMERYLDLISEARAKRPEGGGR